MTTKSATVTGADTREQALSAVMAHFGENKDSLFGTRVVPNGDGSFTVSLHTD